MKINGISFEDHKIHTEIVTFSHFILLILNLYSQERIKERFDRIQETLTNERVRKNPHEVDTEAAKRLIKGHLQSNDAPREEMKQEEDLWTEVGGHRGKKKIHTESGSKIVAKKSEKIEIEEEDSEDEELEKDLKGAAVKKGKKLHKGSLLPSGTHISWKDEIEKMLK